MKRETEESWCLESIDTKHDVYYEENRQVIDDDFGVSRGFCFDTQRSYESETYTTWVNTLGN